ncbi:hypothetical protein GCM10010339_16030 [Streptomyces alanosinicus]|uniref:Uncharacterized protein n=1 Tax=Streptomyces alanosinicus TaxID=68171 RepID=A0A919D2D0_9ACTN|nr:hypothetical protein GCM10010339_16030 [Streptomyces alanosinicus]
MLVRALQLTVGQLPDGGERPLDAGRSATAPHELLKILPNLRDTPHRHPRPKPSEIPRTYPDSPARAMDVILDP